jgi:hypothetical protein
MCLLMDLPFTDTGQAAEHVHHLPLHASGSATCRRSGVVSYATLQGTSRGCTWRPPARLPDPRGVSRVAAAASAGGGLPRCPVFAGEEEPMGTAYQWEKEENALEEREDVNCIFSLLISKLHATYALPIGD